MHLNEEQLQRAVEEREKKNPQNFNIQDRIKAGEIKDGKVIVTEIEHVITNTPQPETLEQVHQRTVNERYSKDEKGRMIMQEQVSEIHGAADNFWKNIPFNTLPSKGMFYPDDSEITIRSASVVEIRHWSTIDESDFLDMDDKLNFILEKCLRFKCKDGILMWKDIKEIDRFYLVFRIHELTFPNGENKLLVNFGCDQSCKGDGSYSNKIQLTSNHLKMFTLNDKVLQYYNPTKKCFSKESESLGEVIELYVPSIGTMLYVKNIMKESRNNNGYLDKSFLRILPYFVTDWRRMNTNSVEKLRMDSSQWQTNKFLFISALIDEFQKSVNLTVKHECERCSTVLERPLFFRGGFTIKDLFAVSIELDGLV